MSKKQRPTVELLEGNLDVKAFIYQQIVDFNPFVTAETKVKVVARNPRNSSTQNESHSSHGHLKNRHRIAVVLSEGGTTIEAEGEHANIYTAILMAKEKLMQKLIEIQESVISSQDRQIAINQALQNNSVH